MKSNRYVEVPILNLILKEVVDRVLKTEKMY